MRPEPEGFTLYPSLPFIRGLAGGEPQCSKSGLLDGRTTFFAKRQFSLLGIYASHSYPSSSQYKPAWRGGPNAIQIGKVPRLNIQASLLGHGRSFAAAQADKFASLRLRRATLLQPNTSPGSGRAGLCQSRGHSRGGPLTQILVRGCPPSCYAGAPAWPYEPAPCAAFRRL